MIVSVTCPSGRASIMKGRRNWLHFNRIGYEYTCSPFWVNVWHQLVRGGRVILRVKN